MSEKKFMAYGDAESVFTGYANRIKQSPTTFVGTRAQWDALSLSQKAEYTLVDITDDEFSPNNFVDWGSYSILGAKNLLPVTMASQVISGVTFTVDSASGIIGVSGNNSGTPFSDVLGTTLLKPGTYKVTTGQATELNAQIGIAVTNASSGTLLARSWNGTEVFTIASNTQVYFHIEVNVTGAITSTTIYPTCKLASIKDESYAPYSKTNSELTVELSKRPVSFTKILNEATVTAYRSANVVNIRVDFPAQSSTGWVHVANNLPQPKFQNIARGIGIGGGAVNSWLSMGTDGILSVLVQPDETNIAMAFTITYVCDN